MLPEGTPHREREKLAQEEDIAGRAGGSVNEGSIEHKCEKCEKRERGRESRNVVTGLNSKQCRTNRFPQLLWTRLGHPQSPLVWVQLDHDRLWRTPDATASGAREE